MKLFANIKKQIGRLPQLKQYVTTYWSKAPEGRSLTLKEMAAYCIGGMGAVGANILPTYVTLTAGMYIAAALSVNVDDIVLVGIISSIITIIRSPLISMIVDNTRSKMGKFRPWLVILPVPLIILFFLMGWVPSLITDYTAMLVVFVIIFNVLQFFMAIYSLSFTTLIQVISPSPEERTTLMSAGAIVYSLGPSLVNMIFPALANLLFSTTAANGVKTYGINAIGPFRWIIPIMAIICFGLGLLAAFGTKERTVVPKQYVQKVKLMDGIRNSFKNKFFWLNNASLILGTFKLLCTSFTVWICTYMIGNDYAQSIAVTVLGTACVPGMALAPLLIRKLGKKRLIILSNFVTAACSLVMIFCVKVPYLLLVLSFFATLFNSVQVVTTPALQAQIYDYQQYRTGDRLEGFLSQFSMVLTTACGIGFAYITPAVYKAFGFVNDASVLNNPDVIQPIIRVMLIIGTVSGVLANLPMWFWNLSEFRHDAIMKILEVRAKSRDGALQESDAAEIEASIENGNLNALAEYGAARQAECSELDAVDQ